MAAGRPTSYKPEYAERAKELCERGATDVELAEEFDVSVRTLHRWKGDHEEFCHALKAGKQPSDDRIERSLFERASGFVYKEQQAIKIKIGPHEEKIEIVEVERQAPPDTTAMIFWLKNRRPAEWRETKAVELTGANGGPVRVVAQEHDDSI